MSYHDADDEFLIRSTRNGDDRAFDVFVTRHRTRIVRIAKSMVADQEEAYDLAQEAFMKAYRSVRKFRGDCAPQTWLNRIVVNICVDWQRRQKVRRGFLVLVGKREDDSPSLEETTQNGSWEADPAQVLESSKMREIARNTLESLPAKQKAAFILRHFEGLSTREMAETLQCAEGTAKVHLFRATERMRQSLSPFAKEIL